ncbi:phosphotransferase family protein [Tuberibacillus sp. Marseille-P3662]|uniref:phosphotransferase family protein n=1 Tax=Tuberibacillus sp. Marseille-P3662 TaxID=1965358 RepID=UPI000A1CB371|nr:phosphotransferase family protein [Tuberibacillus sp. Marseille-P3662]
MFQLFDNEDWVISSAGGVTGEAYLAQSSDRKIFLKRNSSPFLAVLSAEGIVPKLLWTKRLENGDVITAQEWLNGRELKAVDMKSTQVAHLLKKIHSSEPLVFMLSRLGNAPVTPPSILGELEECYAKHRAHAGIREAMNFLKTNAKNVNYSGKVVCHSDINHNNWLMDNNGYLYLVDWDQAIIADPALDLGLVLYWYIDEAHWAEWLAQYGWPLTADLRLRMHWYMLSQTLMFMFWHWDRGQYKQAKLYETDLLRLNRFSHKYF